jgi:hypothetical protein
MKAGGKTAGLLLVLAHRFFRCRDHTFSKHEPALNEEARFPNPHLEALEGKSPALSRRQNSG